MRASPDQGPAWTRLSDMQGCISVAKNRMFESDLEARASPSFAVLIRSRRISGHHINEGTAFAVLFYACQAGQVTNVVPAFGPAD